MILLRRRALLAITLLALFLLRLNFVARQSHLRRDSQPPAPTVDLTAFSDWQYVSGDKFCAEHLGTDCGQEVFRMLSGNIHRVDEDLVRRLGEY